MSLQDDAFARHQQARWMKPDAARWVRPDAARFVRPGTRVEDAYPALARKYNPDQPRTPAGNGEESGRWTSGGSGSGRPRIYIRTSRREDAPGDGADTSADLASANPLGAIDFGDIGAELQSLNLFGTVTRELLRGLFRLAGDLPDGLGGPEEPPTVPKKRPSKSWERTSVARAVANWAGRAPVAAETLTGIYRTYGWLREYEDLIKAARDPARTLQELQADLTPRAGYDKHHIVEKTAAQSWGFAKDDTEHADNLVMIPRLKHYQITGWYATRSKRFGGQSPREYLSDKTWEERRAVGLEALEFFGVLSQ